MHFFYRTGPTGTGKTSHSIFLVQTTNAEKFDRDDLQGCVRIGSRKHIEDYLYDKDSMQRNGY